MSSPIIPLGKALLLKLPGQQPTPPSTYLVAFTGSVLFCSVGRDSVHIQHCRVDRGSARMQRCCHRMRVHSIALPLLHRRQGQLLHRRQGHLLDRRLRELATRRFVVIPSYRCRSRNWPWYR
jgi:hypothetical protein